MPKYQINIKQSGNHSTALTGDYARLITNFNTFSPVQDAIEVLRAIRKEIEVMDIPADVREEADLEVDRAITQLKKEEPDKSKVLESLKKVADTIKNSASIALGVGKFWILLRKAIEWLI